MRKFILATMLALAACLPASAQTTRIQPWSPVGKTVTLAVTTSSAAVALGWADGGNSPPSAAIVCNAGPSTAFVRLGKSTAVAVATDFPVNSGACPTLNLNGATHLAAITSSSTATLTIASGDGTASGGAGAGGSEAGGMLIDASNSTSTALGTLGVKAGLTAGSVLFAGSGGAITQNNSALNWNDSTKVFTVNANLSAAPPTPTTFIIGKFAGMDTGNARVNITAFGGFPALDMYRANGTAAVPSAVLINNPIGNFSGGGYGATGYFSSKAAIVPIASENWTDTAQGTYFSIFTTNTGTTTRPEAARIQPSGGISLGAAAVGTDPGVGGLVASGTIQGLTVITTQSGTTYTLAATDCGTLIRFSSGSAITLTTLNSLPVGCSVAIEQAGAAQITLANGSGATSHSAHSYTKTFGQYAILGLTVDTNAGGTAANIIISGDGA